MLPIFANKIFKPIFLLIGLSCYCTGHSQIQNRICDTIPYEIRYNRLIIPVEVNGIKTRYIIDTGGQTATVASIAVKVDAQAQGYAGVSDLNSNKSIFQKGSLHHIRIGNYTIEKLPSLILPENPFFEELGVAGIIGCEAFAESVITLDSRNQILVINSPYRPERLKISDGLPLRSSNSHHPIVEIKLGTRTKEILFDTGVPEFLLLSTDDCNDLINNGDCRKIAEGNGIVGAGISGLGQPVTLSKVIVPELSVMNKTFTTTSSTTSIMGQTIIGADLLKYGKVIIDFLRKRFYFLPYNPGSTDMQKTTEQWNIGVLPLDGCFRITTVWNSLYNDVCYGDTVIAIDNHRLDKTPLSESAILQIMNLIPGDTAYIVVLKNGIEKKIGIRKE